MADHASLFNGEATTGANVDVTADPVNAQLRSYLINGGFLHQESSKTFLNALERYAIPITTAAIAHDVAGYAELRTSRTHAEATSAMPLLAAEAHHSPNGRRGDGRKSRSLGAGCQTEEEAYDSIASASPLTAALEQFWQVPRSEPRHGRDGAAASASPNRDAPSKATVPPSPLWIRHSPFRFCASPAFHAALQRLAVVGKAPERLPPPQHQNYQYQSAPPHAQGSEASLPIAANEESLLRGGTYPSPVCAEASGRQGRGDSEMTNEEPILPATAAEIALQVPWRAIDAWCHGFYSFTTRDALDGSPRRRKRVRAEAETTALGAIADGDAGSAGKSRTTPAAASSSSSATIASGMAAEPSVAPAPPRTTPASRNPARPIPPVSCSKVLAAAAAAVFANSMPVEACGLQRRVVENDNLLDMLLGAGEESSSLPPSPLPYPGACPHNPFPKNCDEDDETSRTPRIPCDGDGGSPVGAGGRRSIHEDETALEPSLTTPSPTSDRAALGLRPSFYSNESASAAPPRPQITGDLPSRRPPLTRAEEASASPIYSSTSTVKELKAMCAERGLLSTGTKAFLQQRLELYQARLAEKQARQQEAALLCSVGGEALVTKSSSAVPPLPSPSFRSSLSPASPLAVAGPSRVTGSPPRTVFRYRSPSQPCTRRENCGLSGTASAAAVPSSDSPHWNSGAAAPPSEAADFVSPNARRRRRLVPSPSAFLEELVAKQPQASAVVREESCVKSPASSSSPRDAREAEEKLKAEVSRIRWQWLVDYRERARAGQGGGRGGGGRAGRRGEHAGMLSLFRRQQVPCTSVTLPAGDFMLAMDLTAEEASTWGGDGRDGEDGAPGPSLEEGEGDGMEAVLGYVCSIVVERKTAADLDASVKGSRYLEQRRLLAAAAFRIVVWLVEDTDGGGGYDKAASRYGGTRGGPRFGVGGAGGWEKTQRPSRSPSPIAGVEATAPVSWRPSPVESARQRVDSACASLGLHERGWLVVRTRSTAESVKFLLRLATQVARQLACQRLRLREARSTFDDARVARGALLSSNAAVPCPPPTLHSPSPAALFFHVRPEGLTCDAARQLVYPALLYLAPTSACLLTVASLQRRLRAQTAFPRMLLCVRGCSPALAAFLSGKYGTLLRFWRELRRRGRAACDNDPDLRDLTTAQKKVYVLLTEFLLARDYL